MKKIFVLGPTGTHSHHAALSAFENADQHIKFVDTNRQVLECVMSEGGLGVVPIENSTEGLVRPVVDYWIDLKSESRPIVIGDVSLPIAHSLICHPSLASTAELTAVSSHPQALAQCRNVLDSWHMLKTRIPAESTAAAVRDLAKGILPPTCAVLASPFAAEIYGMTVLAENMQDSTSNTTRFHVISFPHGARSYTAGSCRDGRTAMIIYVENTPGSLLGALWAIDVDMSSIHSIPLGKPGEYAFYVEFEANTDYDKGNRIMIRLRTVTSKIIVLGSYSQTPMCGRRIK